MRTVVLSAAAFCLLAGCGEFRREGRPRSYRDKASNPSPGDGAKGVSPDIRLRWTGGPHASYNVYLGTESPPPFAGNQTGTFFDPGPLDWDQTYYWKVDTVGGTEGDIWSFTTFWYGDPNAEEMDVRLNSRGRDKTCASAKTILQKRL